MQSSFSQLDIDDVELDGAPAFKMGGKLVLVTKTSEGSLIVRIQNVDGWSKLTMPYGGDTPTEACADSAGRCYIRDMSGNLYKLSGLNKYGLR